MANHWHYLSKLKDSALQRNKILDVFTRAQAFEELWHYEAVVIVPIAMVPGWEEFAAKHELCDHVQFLVTSRAYPTIRIHRDFCEASINIPLLNCDEKTHTVFYKEIATTESAERFGAISLLNHDSVVEDRRYSFHSSDSRPILFNSSHWHSVINTTEGDSARVMFTWRFKTSWSDTYNKMKAFL